MRLATKFFEGSHVGASPKLLPGKKKREGLLRGRWALKVGPVRPKFLLECRLGPQEHLLGKVRAVCSSLDRPDPCERGLAVFGGVSGLLKRSLH